MKWSLFACAVGGLVLVPMAASAETVKAIPIGYMAYKTPGACGMSIEVTQSNGGLTDGTEKLSLGLKYNYTFGAGGFNPPAGGFGVGAKVLFASPSFASETGAKADITIPDADCTDFNKTGGSISFSGSLGRNPNIIKYEVPPEFGTWRAITPTRTIDLSKESFPFGGFTGTWTLTPLTGGGTSGGTSGTTSSGAMPTSSSGGTSDSGGCAVSASHAPGSGASTVGLAAAALGAVLALRRRRRTAR